MLGRLFTLIGLWAISLSVMATSSDSFLENLRSRLRPLSPENGNLIQSYPTKAQSYIYDQALAVIAFTKANDKKSARSLLRAMQTLQLPDGSLYFSYYTSGESPYPTEGDKRYAGAIAWVSMAANQYQSKFNSTEFVKFNSRILKYLSSQLKTVNIKGLKTKALRFGPSDIKETPWNENETAALEHNLDAYAAFRDFNKLNDSPNWKKETIALRGFILSLWDKENSHFWSGMNLKTAEINKDELYLDNQSWSFLALDTDVLRELKFEKAFALNCEKFYVDHEGVSGFMDSKPTRYSSPHSFVWSEGTLGQVIAMKKYEAIYQKPIICQDKKITDLIKSILNMTKEDGGIAYATQTSNKDFTTSSSVAGTAWMFFALNEINPFEIEDRKKLISLNQ